MSPCSIVVAGDAAVDWFLYPVAAHDDGENWRRRPALHSTALPGGVLLLSEFLRRALSADQIAANVAAPEPPADLRTEKPERIVHSNSRLELFRVTAGKSAPVLRVQEWLGYIGPSGTPAIFLPPSPNVERASLVVLDDAGNGFRDHTDAFPRALTGAGEPLVIHKMSAPLGQGALWNQVRERHRDRQVLVLNATDLRSIAGVELSRSLSWERTAKEFVYHLERSREFQFLRECRCLVVLFGTDGAIVSYLGEPPRSVLIFDPVSLEGSFAASISGEMSGLSAAFTATLAAGLVAGGLGALESSVSRGLTRMRDLLRFGLRLTGEGVAYPWNELFAPGRDTGGFEACTIEPSRDLTAADPDFWRILDQRTRNTRPLVAEQIVVEGDSSGLRGVPIGKFGHLKTIDRAEIESYSAIRELIIEFLSNPKPERPLSFAVFGPPGAGKSFGVKQVLASINVADLETRTFNISQFRSYEDLTAAFHEVRNIGLRGKIPFIFFDEFDSSNGDVPLGWLKYFLAPMQDGEFKEGNAVHPIGKAIFVFAGGTRSTFGEFASNQPVNADADSAEKARDSFRAAKGPDFVSRLRGFINIMGPNRQRLEDSAYVIRRAMVLRSMLDRNPKAKGMFDSQGRLRIDDNVLRALLYLSEYRHGTRSMEAILDMSRLAGRRRFDLAALPPEDQLELHVDAAEFSFLLERERFTAMLTYSPDPRMEVDGQSPIERDARYVDAAARLIHEDYLRQTAPGPKSEATTVPFDQLSDEKKRSNLDAAADIPRKLRLIGYSARPISPGRPPRTPDILDADVQTLARIEHERWCGDQRLQGYVRGPAKDPVRKTSPYLIPFDRLPPEIQQLDIQTIYEIPVILKQLGLEAYRLEESEDITEPQLIDTLARLVHENYVRERSAAGETRESNSSLAPFDELPEDLRQSNSDNAETIPRKLRRIGYVVHRVRPGAAPSRLQLTPEEVEQLSIMEHARWAWHRRLQGWKYAPGKKNVEQKTSPDLVPWEELSESIRELDRETVRLIPELLVQAGYEAHKT